MPAEPSHTPVLVNEVISLLDPRPGETVLDCTAGAGGHAAAMAGRIGRDGTLIVNDFDPGSLSETERRIGDLPEPPRLVTLAGNFAEAPRKLSEGGLSAEVVLGDLGFASGQMDDAARGMSFGREGPLDMRFDPASPVSAADLVNTLSERELAEIIRDFGEERHARRIAEKLVWQRRQGPIQTTTQLAEAVRSVSGRRGGSQIDPATRTFQALRIAVNDELGNLDALLEHVERAARAMSVPSAPRTWLRQGARIGLISFHSLEDRRVKGVFGRMREQGVAEVLTRKPVTATQEEIRSNSRARSAKLRVVRLTPRGGSTASEAISNG